MRVSPELLSAAAAGRTVVTPNGELASALFDALEREQRATGESLWNTARVRDFGSWQRERHLTALLEDSDRPRALNDVEERELWRQVIESAPQSADLLDLGVAARAARRARRAMFDYEIPWAALERDASEETRVFLDWNERFEEHCRKLNCTSSDTLCSLSPKAAEAFVWVESPDWRPVARRWLERHAPALVPLRTPARAVSLVRCGSPDEELAEIAQWARLSLESFADFRAWICIPDLKTRRSEVDDAFDAALAPSRFELRPELAAAPYAVAGGTPLADFPPVAAALAVLRAAGGGLSFIQFSALLRLPQLQGSLAESVSAARVDLELRQRGPQWATLGAWLNLAELIARERHWPPAPALSRLRTAAGLLAEGRNARRFSEWLPLWVKALEAAPWHAAQSWSSAEYQAAERFRELLGSLAAADEFFGSQGRESALRVLGRAAHETLFQPQTGVPPIWVSGQLSDPWLQYDGLWVAGLSEERWPQPVDPLPLLPLSLQREYHIPGADAGARHSAARHLQELWGRRATQCVFSAADAADGRRALPSQILPPAAPAGGDALSHPHWHAQFAAAPTLERFTDERAPPFAPPERTRGVHTLRAQSRCAFKGFAEVRLRADGLELPVPGFNERERGELTHAALEHIWRELKDSAGLQAIDPQAEYALLDVAIDTALRAVCVRRDPGARWRQRERDRLHTLLGRWLEVERRRSPFRVETIEGDMPGVQIGGVELRIRLDRADVLLDGGRVLIDYKTGTSQPDWRGERPSNPQLPLYALLSPTRLVAVAYAKVNAAEPRYIFESEQDAVFAGRKRTALEGETDFAALIERYRERITRIASQFAAGHAEVAPTATACRTCRLQGLCRVSASLEESVDDE